MGADETVVPRDVEDSDDPARDGVPDRRGGARQIRPAVAEVFGGHELHRATVGDRRSDRVRAGGGFAPIAARHEVDAREAALHVAVAGEVHDAAASVGEDDHVAGIGQLLREAVDHRQRRAQQRLVGVPQIRKLCIAREGERREAARRIDVHLAAARPRTRDERTGRLCVGDIRR